MSKKKILIIEDEPVTLRSFSTLLEDQGYEILCSTDGPQGVSLALGHKPDLVILDLVLPSPDPAKCPRFDGFSVLNWLRRVLPDRQTPILIVTGLEAQGTREQALQAGATSFLTKPVDPRKLLLAIRIALDEV